jgi:ribosome-binding factor A
MFQKEVGRQATMKFTPRIKFMADDTFENAKKIDDILRGIHIPSEENSGDN